VYPFFFATGHVKRNLKINFLIFQNFQCTLFSPPLVIPKNLKTNFLIFKICIVPFFLRHWVCQNKCEKKFFDVLKILVHSFFSATDDAKKIEKKNLIFKIFQCTFFSTPLVMPKES